MTNKVDECVKGIGKSYSQLLAEGTIPAKSLQYLFEGDDEPYLSIEDGLSLSFSEEKMLQHVYVTLLKTVDGTKEYKGSLPEPLIKQINQRWVREKFGAPADSKEPVKIGRAHV